MITTDNVWALWSKYASRSAQLMREMNEAMEQQDTEKYDMLLNKYNIVSVKVEALAELLEIAQW